MKDKLEERKALRRQLLEGVENGSLSLSEALKLTRKVVNKNQADYAKIVGVSKKVISDLELDKANPTLTTINMIFAPVGLKVGLIRQGAR